MRMIIWLSVLIALTTSCNGIQSDKKTTAQPDRYIIGYVFPGNRILNVNEIDAEKLTHINYAFANIKDGKIIEGFQNDAENFAVLNSLKERNPDLQILISVGGWTWSGNFSDMALTPESREVFISSSVDFIKRYQLDGLDLDWEYPGLVGNNNTYRAEDRENFVALLKECREALDAAGGNKHYLLTIAAGASQSFIDANNMDEAARYLDFVNLMTYDYAGEWSNITGHHANLFSSEYTVSKNSAEASVKIFAEAGVPMEKMVLGAAFYGRGWKEVAAGDHNGIGQSGKGPIGRRLHYTNIVTDFLTDENFKEYWDKSARAPYLYNITDSIFITYENPRSILEKCRYVNEHNLKGIMFWQYAGDHEGELLDALNEGLRR